MRCRAPGGGTKGSEDAGRGESKSGPVGRREDLMTGRKEVKGPEAEDGSSNPKSPRRKAGGCWNKKGGAASQSEKIYDSEHSGKEKPEVPGTPATSGRDSSKERGNFRKEVESSAGYWLGHSHCCVGVTLGATSQHQQRRGRLRGEGKEGRR